ncbi:DUF1127 domain-containing protein [Rhodovibrionaceae bacterium A322]
MTVAYNTLTSSELLAIQVRAQHLQSAYIADLAAKGAKAIGYLTGINSVAARLKRSYVYHKTLAELQDLDNRILRDIGVNFGEMEFTAKAASVEAAPETTSLLGDFVDYLANARRRYETRSQLLALDNHILADIGLTRGDIDAAVGSVKADEVVKKDTVVAQPLENVLVKPASDQLQAANCNPVPQTEAPAKAA